MTPRDLAILLIWLYGQDESPHKGWLMGAGRQLRIGWDTIKAITQGGGRFPVPVTLARDVEWLVAVHLSLTGWQAKRSTFRQWCATEGLSKETVAALDKAIAAFAKTRPTD